MRDTNAMGAHLRRLSQLPHELFHVYDVRRVFAT